MQNIPNKKTTKEDSKEFEKQMADAYKEFMKVHFNESVMCEECKDTHLK